MHNSLPSSQSQPISAAAFITHIRVRSAPTRKFSEMLQLQLTFFCLGFCKKNLFVVCIVVDQLHLFLIYRHHLIKSIDKRAKRCPKRHLFVFFSFDRIAKCTVLLHVITLDLHYPQNLMTITTSTGFGKVQDSSLTMI